jgi:hypothetical protein
MTGDWHAICLWMAATSWRRETIILNSSSIRIGTFDKRAIAETKRLVYVAILPPDAEIAPEWVIYGQNLFCRGPGTQSVRLVWSPHWSRHNFEIKEGFLCPKKSSITAVRCLARPL